MARACRGTNHCQLESVGTCRFCDRALCERHAKETTCRKKGHELVAHLEPKETVSPAVAAREEKPMPGKKTRKNTTAPEGPTETELREAWEYHETCGGVARALGLRNGAAAFQKLKAVGVDARSEKAKQRSASPTPKKGRAREEPSKGRARKEPAAKSSGVRVLDGPPAKVDCPGCGRVFWITTTSD